jgi:DNA-binding LacI/PurR family transcriptional regulator
MLERGIRGVILGSSPLSLKHLSRVTKRGLQVVAFDRLAEATEVLKLDSVRVDSALGAKLAITHLLELGHRRIGFISGAVSSASRRDRLEGYRATLQAAGIAPAPDLIWMENVSPTDSEEEATEIGRVAALSLLNRPDRPTAFFAINDMTAVGIYAGIRELGLRVPQDISVVGFDDIHLCRIMNPPMTTVRQPLEQLMRSAVNLLIGRMEGKNTEPPANITLVPELMVRASTAAPPDKK